jgi:hypothetical protein
MKYLIAAIFVSGWVAGTLYAAANAYFAVLRPEEWLSANWTFKKAVSELPEPEGVKKLGYIFAVFAGLLGYGTFHVVRRLIVG